VQELVARLRDGDEAAWVELRGMGSRLTEALPMLAELLSEGDDSTRLAAIEVLETLRTEAAPALPQLERALHEGPTQLRAAAADTLAAIGVPALAILRESLAHEDADVRLFACRGLGSIRATAAGSVPALIERMRDRGEEEEVRLRAIWALGEIGTDQAVDAMAEVFVAEGGVLGLWIAEALAKMGRPGRGAADALRTALHQDDEELALAAAASLLEMGRHEEQAIWTLIRWLQDGDEDTAAEAALILGESGARAIAAIPALKHAEKIGGDDLRSTASVAIAKIRPEYAGT
jgi:HEAT repeat protein